MAPKESQTIDLGTLDKQELAGLREQLEADVQNLTQSAFALQRAAGEFGKSGQAIERLAEQQEGQPMLVPLTGSLYVDGTIAQPDNVLLDIGTGYFIETSSDKGMAYCKRKVHFLRDQIQKVVQELKSKQRALDKVSSVLAQRAKQ